MYAGVRLPLLYFKYTINCGYTPVAKLVILKRINNVLL